MKKIKVLILIAISLFAFNSCNDDDAEYINYVAFESSDFNFGVELDGSSSNDIKIYSTQVLNSARTIDINVASESTADPASYDVPSSITIPGNSNVGTATITVSDINISENGETLVLEFVQTDELFTGEKMTLNIKQVCPLNEVILDITFDAYPEETSWELFDSNNDVIASGGEGGAYAGESSFVKAFCLANGTYTFTIYDAWGDGINAPGNYKLIYNGSVIATGADFGLEDSTTFDVSM